MDKMKTKEFFENNVAAYTEGMLDKRKTAIIDAMRHSDPELDNLARMHEQILATLNSTEEVQSPEHLRENILAAVRSEAEEMIALESRVKRKAFLISASFFAVMMALLTALTKGIFNGVAKSGFGIADDALSYVFSEFGKFVGRLASNQQWMANIQIFLDSISRSTYISGTTVMLSAMLTVTALALSAATYYILNKNMQNSTVRF